MKYDVKEQIEKHKLNMKIDKFGIRIAVAASLFLWIAGSAAVWGIGRLLGSAPVARLFGGLMEFFLNK